MIVLGVSGGFGHEAAACLVVDGVVVAMVEEERLCRRKHAEGELPTLSMQWCLEYIGVGSGDVDALALSWDPARDTTALPLLDFARAVAAVPLWDGSPPETVPVAHHLAHAASAFWPSGYDECTTIVVDGNGEDVATTVWDCAADELKIVHELSSTQSLGHLYNAVTEYVGLGRHSAGKLMGLAAYGSAEFSFPKVSLDSSGYHLDIPDLDGLPSPQRFIELRRFWRGELLRTFGPPFAPDQWALLSPGDVPQHHADVAASAQRVIAGALESLVRAWVPDDEQRRVALAGGVALNCSANGALLTAGILDELFVVPPAHDAGAALGAALYVSAQLGVVPAAAAFSPFLGPEPAEADARRYAIDCGLTVSEPADISAAAASHLERGAVVGWVQGRAEVGPRALGARSILASPGDAQVRDRVNDIKGRERWRPLSPSIEAGAAAASLGIASPYMLLATQVPESLAIRMPATVHVDGSSRPQTVDAATGDGSYLRLLTEVGRRTGLPAVLNTSFNLANEPIVCSGRDAVNTYLRSSLDALIVGDLMMTK